MLHECRPAGFVKLVGYYCFVITYTADKLCLQKMFLCLNLQFTYNKMFDFQFLFPNLRPCINHCYNVSNFQKSLKDMCFDQMFQHVCMFPFF